MRLSITGSNLPGCVFCRPDGSVMTNVHVGLQVGREPAELVKADSSEAVWGLDIDAVEGEGGFDFRGPTVHGKRGERFIYLTWGEVSRANEFEMFRRAKIMLNRIDESVMRLALDAGHLFARVDLTGDDDGPRCARVDPPAIEWSVPAS